MSTQLNWSHCSLGSIGSNIDVIHNFVNLLQHSDCDPMAMMIAVVPL